MNYGIPISQPSITELEIQAATEAVRSGWISSSGKNIGEFEKQFAEFCGAGFAVSCSNGTTGLHLTLVARGIGPNDEVIVPDLTFIGTANIVVHAGAKPVFVDIDPETLCIDPEKIEQAITPRTRAIIPVHLYGHPAAMTEIRRLANRYGLIVVEDSAEAHGAEIQGARVGSLGDSAVFSFFGNKIVSTGEGGMITTNDQEFADRCRMLRDHGMSREKRYWHTVVGYNYRMTNVQAAIGLAQLSRISHFLKRRQEILSTYRDLLSDDPRWKLNRTKVGTKNVVWMVCLEREDWKEGEKERFMAYMAEHGVETRPYFYPCSDMPMYKGTVTTPVSHAKSLAGLNLPTFSDITDDQIRTVSRLVKGWTSEGSK